MRSVYICRFDETQWVLVWFEEPKTSPHCTYKTLKQIGHPKTNLESTYKTLNQYIVKCALLPRQPSLWNIWDHIRKAKTLNNIWYATDDLQKSGWAGWTSLVPCSQSAPHFNPLYQVAARGIKINVFDKREEDTPKYTFTADQIANYYRDQLSRLFWLPVKQRNQGPQGTIASNPMSISLRVSPETFLSGHPSVCILVGECEADSSHGHKPPLNQGVVIQDLVKSSVSQSVQQSNSIQNIIHLWVLGVFECLTNNRNW